MVPMCPTPSTKSMIIFLLRDDTYVEAELCSQTSVSVFLLSDSDPAFDINAGDTVRCEFKFRNVQIYL